MTLERNQALSGDPSKVPGSDETKIEAVLTFVSSHLSHMGHQALGRYILVCVCVCGGGCGGVGKTRVYLPHGSDEPPVSP